MAYDLTEPCKRKGLWERAAPFLSGFLHNHLIFYRTLKNLVGILFFVHDKDADMRKINQTIKETAYG